MTITGFEAEAPSEGVLERAASKGVSIRFAYELCEGPLFYELRIVPQQSAEGTGDRLHQSRRRDQHRDRRHVLHEGPEAGLLVAGDLKAPSFGQVPKAEENCLVVEPVDGRADNL